MDFKISKYCSSIICQDTELLIIICSIQYCKQQDPANSCNLLFRKIFDLVNSNCMFPTVLEIVNKNCRRQLEVFLTKQRTTTILIWCAERGLFHFFLLCIIKMVYYCTKSKTEKTEAMAFFLLCLYPFQSHVSM